MRVEDDITQTYYMMPGLCILFLSPFNIKSELISNESKIIFFRYTKCVSLILPIFIISNYLIWIKSEGFVYPRPHSQKLFEFNRALVSEINNSLSLVKNNSPVIDTNFDYYARYIVPELMLRFNRLGRQGNVFQIRKSQWKISGPFPDNLTHSLHFSSDMEKDKELIIPAINKQVDIFVVLTNYDSPESMEALKDIYTRDMAIFVADKIKNDKSRWQYVGQVESPYKGDVLIYLNKEKQISISGNNK